MSPGVPLSVPAIRRAREAGIEVIGEMELASRYVDVPVLAVTGSNGKTTTVSLTDHILTTAGISHWTAGNIGRPLSAFLNDQARDPRAAVPSVVLTEVSSFQMETISRFRPWIAAWTNLSPDHLDRYPDMESYAQAKVRVFMNQTPDDIALVPRDDAWLDAHRDLIRGRVLRFGAGGTGASLPDIVLDGNELRMRLSPERAEEAVPLSRIRLVGRHNRENVMVAVAMARLCGADPVAVQQAIESFEGLEHRLEYVDEVEGVRFYNDSKATTVASVVCALTSFDCPVVLLAGGKDKGGSYEPLRKPLGEHARRLILFGAAAERMEKELVGSCPLERVGDLEAAVRRGLETAERGGVVLLSPVAPVSTCSGTTKIVVSSSNNGSGTLAVRRRGGNPGPDASRAAPRSAKGEGTCTTFAFSQRNGPWGR